MAEESDSLIDATVRKMDDPELQLAVRGFLRECSVPVDHHSVRRSVERFDAIDRSAHPNLPRWILLGAVIILSLLTGTPQVMDGLESYRAITSNNWDNYKETMSHARESLGDRGWSAQDKILLFGEWENVPQEQRLRTLRQLAEEDPVLLSEYLQVYQHEKAELPPDFTALAGKVDPDNAFFGYFSAALMAKNVAKEITRTRAEIKAGKPRSWDIKDPEKLAKVLELMTAAGRKPVLKTYVEEQLQRRALLLPWNTREERRHSALFVFSTAHPGFLLSNLGPAIAAESQRLAAIGDRESFIKLAESTETMLKLRLGEIDPTVIGGMMLLTNISRIYEQFAIAARTLGLDPEAARYSAVNDRIRVRTDAIKARQRSQTGREPLAIKTGLEIKFLDMMPYLVAEPPPVDEGRLLPGAFTDHALYSRGLAAAGWAWFGLAAGALMLHRFLIPPLVRSAGKRLGGLLVWSDYAVIAGIAFVIPTAYVLAVSRFTPLGAREFNLRGTYGLLPTTHFAALFLMMMILAVLTGRRRLNRWGKAFDLGRSWTSKTGWISLAFTAIHVPVMGYLISRQLLDWTGLYLAGALLAPGLSWLLVIFFKGAVGSAGQRLNSAAMVPILVPVCGLAMIWMLLLLPLFKAEENHWVQRDHFLIDTAGSEFAFPYEREVAIRFNRELQTVMGFE